MENKELTPLEKYLLQNRSELDRVEEVNVEGIWEKLEEQMELSGAASRESGSEERGVNEGESFNHRPPSPWHISIGRNWRWGIAASIALVVGMYFLLPKQQEPTMANVINELLPEIAEQTADYQRLIAQKEGALNLEEVDKKAFKDIFTELQLLEELHKEYLQDLPRYEKNDQLVNTLLRYYERKIKILERLSREIEKKKSNHEKVSQEKFI